MICPKCEKEIANGSNFCYFCGERTAPAAQPPPATGGPSWTSDPAGQRRLLRSVTDRKLGGVCAGLAHYLDIDVAIVRVLAVASVLFYGIGLFSYLVAWMVIPEGDATTMSPQQPTSKRLHRSATDRRIGGVCGGVAEFLDADPTIIRLVWALSFFVFGAGGILYLLLWFVLPLGNTQPAGMQTAG
jgi:phage shock protein PspC (stress-responsive transcriptional regulator)